MTDVHMTLTLHDTVQFLRIYKSAIKLFEMSFKYST